MPAPQIFLII